MSTVKQEKINKQVATIETHEKLPAEATSFESALLDIVKRTDIDPERLEKFLDLHAKMQSSKASVAFFDALAGFQGDCPIIPRSKEVKFISKNGKQTDYNYAPIEEIVEIIKPHLVKWGLSFSFNIKKTGKDDENELLVTIRHRSGHAETTSLFFNPIHDDERMNRSQRAKSSITYAKRSGLENALGIVTAGEDDDAGADNSAEANKEQIAEIKKLIKETESDEQRLLVFLNVESLEQLSLAGAKEAIHALKQKKGSK